MMKGSLVCIRSKLRFQLMALVFATLYQAIHSYTNNHQSPQQSLNNRRAFVSRSAAVVTTIGIAATIHPAPCRAEFNFVGGPPPMMSGPPLVREWPRLECLVPIYTFQSALDILAQNLRPEAGADGIRKSSQIIDTFLDGGFLSNASVFRGMCAIYISEIYYLDPDRRRINEDRVFRLKYSDTAVDSLKAMQRPLKQLKSEGAVIASDEVTRLMNDAQSNISSFLSLVPKQDIEDIQKWMDRVKDADLNQNGQLQGNELNALSADDLKLYNVVGNILG